MKRDVFLLLPLVSMSLLFPACEKEVENGGSQSESEVAVIAKTDQDGQDAQAATRSTNSATFSGAVITDAKVSVEEFELEAVDLSAALNILSELEVELKNPRVVTLIADGEAQAGLIAEGNLQHALYTEAEFSYERNLSVSATDEMHGKSILIKGKFEGMPFVCWTDEESDVEITFDEGIDVKDSGEIYVTFYLNRLLSKIDFSLATDGNANGVIEVGPDGIDGNAALYAALKGSLNGIAELED